MLEILNKAEMRNFVALIMIFLMIGSWIFFLSQVKFDDTKKLDLTLLVMLFANIIVGTLVGIFAWLGFKQGKAEPSIPQITIPDGFTAEMKNGILVLTKK